MLAVMTTCLQKVMDKRSYITDETQAAYSIASLPLENELSPIFQFAIVTAWTHIVLLDTCITGVFTYLNFTLNHTLTDGFVLTSRNRKLWLERNIE